MKNPPYLLSGQFNPVAAAKIIMKKNLTKAKSIFVSHTYEKLRTKKNAILWFFGVF